MTDSGHNNPPSYPPLDSSGWIKRHRKVRDHHLVGHGLAVRPADPTVKKCHNKGEAWEDLCMMAEHSGGREIDVMGDTVILDIGQLLAGTDKLGKRWNWTRQTVRTWFARLEREGMIKLNQPRNQLNNQLIKRGKKAAPNIATICNYRHYQVLEREISDYVETVKQPAKQPPNQPTSNQLATSWQPASNQKERIKELNKNNRGGKKQDQLFDEETKQPINQARDKANKAIDLYNEMAKEHGWTVCRVRKNRIAKMRQRLKDIEGLENFKLALEQIPKNDFLSGRMPPKNGTQPFRMDIERLMSTGSALGDVLAKLIDIAASEPEKPKSVADVNAHIRTLSIDQQSELVRKYANGTYPASHLGSAPGTHECPMHIDVLNRFNLLERYDELGRER